MEKSPITCKVCWLLDIRYYGVSPCYIVPPFIHFHFPPFSLLSGSLPVLRHADRISAPILRWRAWLPVAPSAAPTPPGASPKLTTIPSWSEALLRWGRGLKVLRKEGQGERGLRKLRIHWPLQLSGFLDASKHLYKRVCPSVRPCVRSQFRKPPKMDASYCPPGLVNVLVAAVPAFSSKIDVAVLWLLCLSPTLWYFSSAARTSLTTQNKTTWYGEHFEQKMNRTTTSLFKNFSWEIIIIRVKNKSAWTSLNGSDFSWKILSRQYADAIWPKWAVIFKE